MSGPKITSYDHSVSLNEMNVSNTTCVQLGPDGAVEMPDTESPRPYLAISHVHPPQWSSSMYHPVYHMMCFTEGSYLIDGRDYDALSVSIIEPFAPTGEARPGPDGVTEFAFFPDGLGVHVGFVDPTSPDVVALHEAVPPGTFPEVAPLPEVHGTETFVDRDKDRVDLPGVALYPCSIGPAKFGIAQDITAEDRYFALAELEPNAEIPEHRFAGWSAVALFEGSCKLGDLEPTKNDILVAEPEAAFSYLAGPNGAKLLMFFENPKGALPHFTDTGSAFAQAFSELLTKNGCAAEQTA